MMAAPSRDWNLFKQIFADHWEPFQHAHPRYQTAYYDDLVAKMLACGNPEKMGYVEYRCLQCGQGTHLVAIRCRWGWYWPLRPCVWSTVMEPPLSAFPLTVL